jgi:hypothetical protein
MTANEEGPIIVRKKAKKTSSEIIQNADHDSGENNVSFYFLFFFSNAPCKTNYQ